MVGYWLMYTSQLGHIGTSFGIYVAILLQYIYTYVTSNIYIYSYIYIFMYIYILYMIYIYISYVVINKKK
jgi:hypothetical protein